MRHPDPAPPPPTVPAAGMLACPADTIFDRDRVCTRLADALGAVAQDDGRAARAAVVTILAAERERGRAAIAAAFAASPRDARPVVRSYSWLADALVEAAFHATTTFLHPLPVPSDTDRLAVVAVGGSGRGEMAPFSDLDLLFLIPWKPTPWIESVIESILYILWDLHIVVGHATRNISECLRQGREDMDTRTALLEVRALAGDEALCADLRRQVRSRLCRGTAAQFIEAKLVEQSARHKAHGGQRFMVEPDVKEGKGGLRDLHTLFWIDKYVHGVDDLALLVRRGVFTEEEFGALRDAEEFLLAVRCHLHLLAGRALERLTFERQIEVAAALGYKDGDGRRAVEHFMQDYFRHATRIGEMTRIFLTDLEERHVKQAAPAATESGRRKRLARPWTLRAGRIALVSESAFLDDPLNFLDIFTQSLRAGCQIHPDALRLIRRNLALIDEPLREDPKAAASFLDLLLRHGNPEHALRRMNELGVLPAFIPEFSPVVAMMQFNMYHAYTVDEHSLQCVSVLARIEAGDLVEDLPLTSRILRAGNVNRRVLYLATLLHDIGKGRAEDHAILGARIARRVVTRLGLRPDEVDTVEWLVRNHLRMSDFAQKRDLSDPRTVRDFAKIVRTRKRLDLLTALTVADIRGVSPTAWNNWKAVLLRNLYRATEEALEGGLEDINRETRAGEAKRELREALAEWERRDIQTELARHDVPYWQGMPAPAHAVFARLLRALPADGIGLDIFPDTDRDATRICFVLTDRRGVFSRLAGALALAGANVVDARTYTTRDGFATAAFWVQDATGHPYPEDRMERLRTTLHRSVAGPDLPAGAMRARDVIRRSERVFREPTSISFDNEGSDIYTLIEVSARDRPGLLYDLTRVLSAASVNIASAVIATYGAQAVDTFYVKDVFGLKLEAADRQSSLEARLREAIEAGVRHASA